MPPERRRSPPPSPDQFANPRAERTYWETEHLLDKAPSTGVLSWYDVYDGWQYVKEDCLKDGQSIEDAKEIAWGSTAFFVAERLTDLRIEFQNFEFGRIKRNQFGRELAILTTWNTIVREATDERSPNFNGEPPSPYVPLTDHLSHQVVEPGNPDSPIFGHLQVLDAAADMELITPELKRVILGYATRKKELLEHAIDDWNNNVASLPDLKGQNPEAARSLRETSYIILAISMADSWGGEDNSMIRFNQFGEYLQRLRNQPHSLIGFLNEDAVEARADSFRKKQGLDETREYAITDTVVRRAKRIHIAGDKIFDKRVASGYVAELAGYRHLDFGAIVTWVPEGNYWTGIMVISQAGHEPPRSFSPLVRLMHAETPQQAIVGSLDYFGKNLDLIKLPYKTELSRVNIRRALRFLSEQRIIYQLHTDSAQS